jgi:hypothetical protein
VDDHGIVAEGIRALLEDLIALEQSREMQSPTENLSVFLVLLGLQEW